MFTTVSGDDSHTMLLLESDRFESFEASSSSNDTILTKNGTQETEAVEVQIGTNFEMAAEKYQSAMYSYKGRTKRVRNFHVAFTASASSGNNFDMFFNLSVLIAPLVEYASK